MLAQRGSFQDPTAERARAALEALSGLPECQRRLFSLQVAGFSYTEIAALEGVTVTAVNRHLVRARANLRDPEGGEL